MEDINFKYNWCDFLTPCPYIKYKEVGSYECSTCEYCKGLNYDETLKTNDTPISDKDYYKRYFIINAGVCKCSFMTTMDNINYKFNIGQRVSSNYGDCIIQQYWFNDFMKCNMYRVKYVDTGMLDTFAENELF